MINQLEAEVLNLRTENGTLLEQIKELEEKMNAITLSPTPSGLVDEDGLPLSDAAIKKRLMRLCSRKADGKLGMSFIYNGFSYYNHVAQIFENQMRSKWDSKNISI